MWALHARQVSVPVGWPLVAAASHHIGEAVKFGKGCKARKPAPMHKGLACMPIPMQNPCDLSIRAAATGLTASTWLCAAPDPVNSLVWQHSNVAGHNCNVWSRSVTCHKPYAGHVLALNATNCKVGAHWPFGFGLEACWCWASEPNP
jgi:hypothetical protein